VKRLIEAPGFGLVCASCDADLYWEARLAALTPEQEAAERDAQYRRLRALSGADADSDSEA
jgi:hypothetical protein